MKKILFAFGVLLVVGSAFAILGDHLQLVFDPPKPERSVPRLSSPTRASSADVEFEVPMADLQKRIQKRCLRGSTLSPEWGSGTVARLS